MDKSKIWYRAVWSGTPNCYLMPPKGAYKGLDAALEAIERWYDRVGNMTATMAVAAHSVVLRGYETRAQARDGDIGDSVGKRGCVDSVSVL